ncbi:MAG: Gfo/Idh/MocA family oxidoreductase [Thermofilaceae archaeon]|nr:Gfo/Idh/MocA family oxidoreductase [Thermofilaceae archaeon]
MCRKVKVGVVGLGNQGILHVAALKEVGEADLVAVADMNRERARHVAEEYRVDNFHYSALDLCKNPEIDAVIVATPDHLHFEPVMIALENGKHVLVEKPMSTKLEEAEKMSLEAKKRNLFLMVNFENRFNPPFRYVKELLQGDELGTPLHAYIRLNDAISVPLGMLSWASKSSVAFFLMSHTVDLARWYFTGPVREVYATSVTKVLRDLGTPDAYGAILKFDEGFALLESSWVLPETSPSIFDFKLELVCTKGAVHVDTEKENISISSSRGYIFPHLAKQYRVNKTIVGFLKEVDRHFVRCILGSSEPALTADDGVENVRVIEAVIRSSSEGKPVKL